MQSPQDQNPPCADGMWINEEEGLKVGDATNMVRLNDIEIRDGSIHQTVSTYIIRDGSIHEIISTHTIRDGSIHRTVSTHTMTDGEHRGPPTNTTNNNNNNTPNDQESSEDKEALLHLLKALSSMACAVINPFNFASFTLAVTVRYPPISKSQKDCILGGSAAFMVFSVITVGVVHGVEGKTEDIDLATTMVIAEVAYPFVALSLDAMFFGGAPWFIIPLGLGAWSVLTGWLVWRYRRPRGIYVMLKKIFKFKMHG